jgi:hypothetical protein
MLMIRHLLPGLIVVSLFVGMACGVAADTRLYELRIYHPAPGKFEALHARFRDHTCKLFEKHGMVNIGYWTPVDTNDSRLIYMLSYPDRAARDASWKAFMNDPEWKEAYKASEANGRLVDKVDSTFMAATDYSPVISPVAGSPERTFELRIYTTPPDKLDALHLRFRDHTVALFTRHGMSHFGYWSPVAGDPAAGHTLVYILAHKSHEAGLASFKEFRADPEWIKVKAASEEHGSLTVENGVKSTYMMPTDYSPAR